MQIDLSSKKILITGASKGIGLAIAQQVVAAGAAVVLHYRSDNESLIELKKEYPSQKIELVCADMNKPEDVQFLWEQSILALGSLTGVVLNAGIFTAHAIEDSSADWMHVWQKTMQVNLNAIGQLKQSRNEHKRGRHLNHRVVINVQRGKKITPQSKKQSAPTHKDDGHGVGHKSRIA